MKKFRYIFYATMAIVHISTQTHAGKYKAALEQELEQHFQHFRCQPGEAHHYYERYEGRGAPHNTFTKHSYVNCRYCTGIYSRFDDLTVERKNKEEYITYCVTVYGNSQPCLENWNQYDRCSYEERKYLRDSRDPLLKTLVNECKNSRTSWEEFLQALWTTAKSKDALEEAGGSQDRDTLEVRKGWSCTIL